MDRHDPDRVIVVFGEDRVGGAALGPLQSRPGQVAPEAVTAGVAPRRGPARSRTGFGARRRGRRASRARRRASRRSSTRAAIRSAGEHQVERSASERTWAIAAATGCPTRASGGWRQIDHDPPRDRQSNSSTSLQPYRPERSAETRASSSVESSAARERQHHVADLGSRVHDRAVLGAVRDVALRPTPPRARPAMCAPGAGSSTSPGPALAQLVRVVVGHAASGRAMPWPRRRRRRPPRASAGLRRSPVAHRGRRARRRRSGVTEPCSRWCGATCRERLIRGLRVGLGLDQLPEDVVDPLGSRAPTMRKLALSVARSAPTWSAARRYWAMSARRNR